MPHFPEKNVKPTVTIVPFVKNFLLRFEKVIILLRGKKLRKEVSYIIFLLSIFSILK
jgi:hypothetical protein